MTVLDGMAFGLGIILDIVLVTLALIVVNSLIDSTLIHTIGERWFGKE
jgi:hypothetical protein